MWKLACAHGCCECDGCGKDRRLYYHFGRKLCEDCISGLGENDC